MAMAIFSSVFYRKTTFSHLNSWTHIQTPTRIRIMCRNTFLFWYDKWCCHFQLIELVASLLLLHTERISLSMHSVYLCVNDDNNDSKLCTTRCMCISLLVTWTCDSCFFFFKTVRRNETVINSLICTGIFIILIWLCFIVRLHYHCDYPLFCSIKHRKVSRESSAKGLNNVCYLVWQSQHVFPSFPPSPPFFSLMCISTIFAYSTSCFFYPLLLLLVILKAATVWMVSRVLSVTKVKIYLRFQLNH